MKVIITGITVQLGWALKRTKPKEIEIIPCNRNLVDLKEEKSIIKFIKKTILIGLLTMLLTPTLIKPKKRTIYQKYLGLQLLLHIFLKIALDQKNL